MKYLEYLIWISGIIAGVVLLLGAIALIFVVKPFGVVHVVNFFHVANSFLLVSICSTLYLLLKQKREG
jgi:hypothetical protein